MSSHRSQPEHTASSEASHFSLARDTIWNFRKHSDAALLLELMRDAELPTVPVTSMYAASGQKLGAEAPAAELPAPRFTLCLATAQERLVLRRWENEQLLDEPLGAREQLDDIPGPVALALAEELASESLWRAVRRYVEERTG
jgi:hypothetical protein